MPEELWVEVHDIVQETGSKIISKKKKCKKAKWLSEEALQIAVKKREVKGKGEKERYAHLNAEFQRIARRDRKALLEKTLKSPLDCKEIQAVHPKRVESWMFIGRTDVEVKTPILWSPDAMC